MAVAVAFRIAIALSPTAYRLVRAAETHGSGSSYGDWATYFWNRLHDPGESDADLQAAIAERTGSLVEVTTFTGTFSTRKLQVVFSFTGGSPRGEDSRVVTFHFLKLASGSPVDTWVSGDFTTLETAMGTYWTALKPYAPPTISLDEYRWYKAGPADAPPQEPVRVVSGLAVVGTATIGGPPQMAVAVTEKTASRKAWGRVYWPLHAGGATFLSTNGRIGSSPLTAIANATDVFYEAALAAGTPVVVYSTEKPSRTTKGGGTLPAIGARALTVDQTQVDDIPDILRSRRHGAPLLRVQRQVGA